MSRPIVALLTDFGTQDHYVAAVKGAVLTVAPEAILVDITHEVAPQDVAGAAFTLHAAYSAFPSGTVFVAVVDPGVGSDRRALALAAGGYWFVGPDNGIFSPILADHPDATVHEIRNRDMQRAVVSTTFHARDVFAPVAAHLATGTPLPSVGPEVPDPETLDSPAVHRRSETEWEARVLHVDRFGNLTTNLSRRDLDRILEGLDPDTDLVVVVNGVVVPLVTTYTEVCEGDACALVGSSDRVELAVNGGSAARLLRVARGSPVRVRAVPLAGP